MKKLYRSAEHFEIFRYGKYAKKKKDLDYIKKDLVTIRNILKSIKESNNIS